MPAGLAFVCEGAVYSPLTHRPLVMHRQQFVPLPCCNSQSYSDVHVLLKLPSGRRGQCRRYTSRRSENKQRHAASLPAAAHCSCRAATRHAHCASLASWSACLLQQGGPRRQASGPAEAAQVAASACRAPACADDHAPIFTSGLSCNGSRARNSFLDTQQRKHQPSLVLQPPRPLGVCGAARRRHPLLPAGVAG